MNVTAADAFIERMARIAQMTKQDPITVALSMKDDPEFQKALQTINRDLEWHWQAWLHEHGDDSRRKYFDYKPARHQIMELIDDWNQQVKYCTTCQKGDACQKVTKKWLADLQQSEAYGDPPEVTNYIVYYPCKYNKYFGKPITKRNNGVKATFNETGSDLL